MWAYKIFDLTKQGVNLQLIVKTKRKLSPSTFGPQFLT